jgi:DNA-directed RNA polymerase specialized sigma24 family protein
MQEREVIHLLKAQKKIGLECLYEQYGPAVYGIIERLSTTEEVAEQLLVRTFLNAWHKSAFLDIARTNLLAWLINITVNTIQENLNNGTIERAALKPFPELSSELQAKEETATLLNRLEREIKNGSAPYALSEEDTGEEKLQYSVLALRARMKINETLLAQ